MARTTRSRTNVTMTCAMTVALRLIAEREGSTPTSVARRLLRAALDRTIHSAEGQDALRRAGCISAPPDGGN